MQTLRKLALTSLFCLTVVALSFGLYPLTAWAVHTTNDGVSGLHADGSPNTYTRLIPAEYEQKGIAVLDIGISVLGSCGLFYGAIFVQTHRSRKSST